MTKLAAIDIGNDSVKAIFGDGERFQIMNVVATEQENREYVEMEEKPIDGLHVRVVSGSLKVGKGIYVVGPLAMKYDTNEEITLDDNKYENDQTIIMLLTSIAMNAVKEQKEDKQEVRYTLSTGLPIKEIRKDARDAFKAKLLNSAHEVEFLDTPQYSGKKVIISFDDVIVLSEGMAAYTEIAFNPDGTTKNEDLTEGVVMIVDIGGRTTDIAVIENGKAVNPYSIGWTIGVSQYLDKIIQEVENEFDYRFKSRRELVDVIAHQNPEHQGHIWVRGNRTDINAIIQRYLSGLAAEEYKIISETWSKMPNAKRAYIIGGGAIALKEYISDINKRKRNYPFQYVEHNKSIWMIAESYFTILNLHLQRSKSA